MEMIPAFVICHRNDQYHHSEVLDRDQMTMLIRTAGAPIDFIDYLIIITIQIQISINIVTIVSIITLAVGCY